MKVVNHFTASEYRAAHAIVLHEPTDNPSNNRDRFATIHDIRYNNNGQAEIVAGVLPSRAELSHIVAGLTPERALRFLPPNLLASSHGTMVWWMRPRKNLIWFRTRDSIGTRSGVVPHPGLVFATSGDNLFVWAVKGSKRPDPKTRLYRAPYYNSYSDGGMCTGTTELPGSPLPEHIEASETAFFGSFFTHINTHGKGQLSQWPGGAEALWKSMLDAPPERFPTDSLVPLRRTLQDAIQALADGKRLV